MHFRNVMTDDLISRGPTLLRDYLRRVGKTQEQFGSAIGRSQGHVSKIISGAIRPELDLAFTIELKSEGQVKAIHFIDPALAKAFEQLPADQAA